MDEFELIRRHFAPLATAPGADGLQDDVAEIETAGRTIATADAIVEGVHFLPDDPLETVGAKLVRVNVSDILAKGGRPRAALLSLVWPRGRDPAGLSDLAKGLRKSLDKWGVYLVGGDTTRTEGPLVLSLTLLGECGVRGPIRRSGARPGDDLWVTGVIGDGWLGLQAATGRFPHLEAEGLSLLVSKYRVPEPPRLDFADLVARFATASIDVSDGLMADAGHLAAASGVGIVIEGGDVPLSAVAASYVENRRVTVADLLTGGDDYQTLFAAPVGDRESVASAAAQVHQPVSRIGCIEAGGGVVVKVEGRELAVHTRGWTHF
jgi:thiamine-monophosphate kinase